MRWPWSREERDYTDDRLAEATARAEGTAASSKVAAIEAASGLWERAFAGAICPSIPASTLALMGRSLLVRGEFVAHRNRTRWEPASDFDISGGATEWSYRITVGGPSTSLTRRVPMGSVMHVRIGALSERPWEGCSPISNSKATRDALAYVERSLSQEHSGPTGHVIGVNDPTGNQTVADTIGDLRGRTVLAEASESDLVGEGPSARNSWMPQRIGPMPSPETCAARKGMEWSIFAAAGIPAELLFPANEASQREAFRRFVHATIQPVSRIVSEELRRLGLDATIDFEELRAADLQSRTRGLKQLIESGVPLERALSIVGLGSA